MIHIFVLHITTGLGIEQGWVVFNLKYLGLIELNVEYGINRLPKFQGLLPPIFYLLQSQSKCGIDLNR